MQDVTYVDIKLGRDLTNAEIEQIEQWIEHTLILIASRFPDLNSLNPEVLRMAVIEVVTDRASTPRGESRREVSIDDGREAVTYTRDRSLSELLEAWWTQLDPATSATGGSAEAFTIAPSYPRYWS